MGFVIEKGHKIFLWPEVAHFLIRIIDSGSLCLPSNPRFTSSTTEDWCSERATLMLLKNCFISTFSILSNTLCETPEIWARQNRCQKGWDSCALLCQPPKENPCRILIFQLWSTTLWAPQFSDLFCPVIFLDSLHS